MRKRLAITALALALATAACSSEDEAATDEPVAEEGAAAGPALGLSSVDLGDIIVDEAGTTLYLFTDDAQGDSTCYDQCASAWPPVPEMAGVGEGLDQGLLGTTTRTDGSVQATYNDWPLYYFASDGGPGDVNGQGVGDVWYVLDSAGTAIGQG